MPAPVIRQDPRGPLRGPLRGLAAIYWRDEASRDLVLHRNGGGSSGLVVLKVEGLPRDHRGSMTSPRGQEVRKGQVSRLDRTTKCRDLIGPLDTHVLALASCL